MKKSRPEIKAKEATKAREATSSTVEIHEEEVETVKERRIVTEGGSEKVIKIRSSQRGPKPLKEELKEP